MPGGIQSPMEKQEKKSFSELFQNKTFLYSVPVFIILVGLLIWYTYPSETAPAEVASAVNTTVPTARTDSTKKQSKLAMQSQTPNELEMLANDPTNGMKSDVPGDKLERLVYAGGGSRRPGSPATGMKIDNDVYDPRTAGNAGTNPTGYNGNLPDPARYNDRYPAGSNQTMPRSLSGRARSMEPPLRERDVMLPDDRSSPARAGQVEDMGELMRRKKAMADAESKRDELLKKLDEYKKVRRDDIARETDNRVVSKVDETGVVGTLAPGSASAGQNAFYGLYTDDVKKQQARKLEAEVGTIRGMVYGDQEIVSGGRVKIRLLEPIKVRGIEIPENSLIYGICSFGAERVQIKINSLMYDQHIFPVSLTVYDMDAITGIYVPAITGLTEARQAIGQSAQGLNVSSYGGGVASGLAQVGTQAGTAAVRGVQQLIQKKTSVQKAMLKNNYYVLLRSTDLGAGASISN